MFHRQNCGNATRSDDVSLADWQAVTTKCLTMLHGQNNRMPPHKVLHWGIRFKPCSEGKHYGDNLPFWGTRVGAFMIAPNWFEWEASDLVWWHPSILKRSSGRRCVVANYHSERETELFDSVLWIWWKQSSDPVRWQPASAKKKPFQIDDNLTF